MSRTTQARTVLVIPLLLATLAGCTDTETIAPKFGSRAHLAQGDNGTWTVNSLADPGDGTCDDTDCTLREAIAAASSGGQVVFAAGLAGPIQLTTGQLAIVDKDLTIDGGGRISVDAQGNSRVLAIFRVDGVRPSVTLTGITLENGYVDVNGGGIHMSGRSLTLDGVTLDNNEARLGGGIYLIDATATIRNSRLTNNTAISDGGGMFIVNGTISVEKSVLSGNSADHGGGIWNSGNLSVIGSTLDQNDASVASGGAIANDGTVNVTESTISRNTGFNGGGLSLYTPGTVTITRSTISGNLATTQAGPFAGGIALNGGTLNLLSSTITGNNQAGISIGGTATARNTIIAGNDVACDDVGGFMTSLGNNLSDFNAACDFDQASDVAVPSGQAFLLVLEPALTDNGGPTLTHALLARGLAIDAGYCPAETTDQRGFTRPVDDPTMPDAADACDIGAYEAQGPQVAVADLMVSQSVDKTSVKQGEMLTYTVRVQNLGPQTAPSVVLNNVLSSGVTFVEARVNKGTTTAPPQGETGTVTWNLGDLADQANEAAEIVVTVLVKGKTTITNTATVSGNVSDPNPANDSAAITVSVVSGKAGGRKR